MVSEELQYALADWPGQFLYHLPQDPRLTLIKAVPFHWQTPCSPSPLSNALTIFADGGKLYGACTYQEGQEWRTFITTPQKSAQRAELAATILAFTKFKDQPFNLILDSLYVTQIVKTIYEAYLSPATDPQLLSLFITLQTLIEQRRQLFFVAHIRSHQPFPGILQEGNDVADSAASAAAIQSTTLLYPLQAPTPWESHSYFHQNKKALMRQFGISGNEAAAIVQQCPECSKQSNSIPMGVNPRGIEAAQIWQMDVTQYPPFAP